MTFPDTAAVTDARYLNTTRVCNALLGGRDAYDLDSAIAGPLLNGHFAIVMREARLFARRAVEYLISEHRVTQVVELGCGYPLPPPTPARNSADRIVSSPRSTSPTFLGSWPRSLRS